MADPRIKGESDAHRAGLDGAGMSSEVAENLREIASNLLAAANRLDGIDVSVDAMRGGTAKSTYDAGRYALTQGVSDWLQAKCADCGKAWLHRSADLPAVLAEHDAEHGAPPEPERSGGMVTYGYGGTAHVPEGFELVQLPEVGWRLTCPCGDHSWTWVHPAVPEQWKIDRAATEHGRTPLERGA